WVSAAQVRRGEHIRAVALAQFFAGVGFHSVAMINGIAGRRNWETQVGGSDPLDRSDGVDVCLGLVTGSGTLIARSGRALPHAASRFRVTIVVCCADEGPEGVALA